MSTISRSPNAGTGAPRSPLTDWLAVSGVTVGILSIVTTEILPIGLLTPIATTFDVSAVRAHPPRRRPPLVIGHYRFREPARP